MMLVGILVIVIELSLHSSTNRTLPTAVRSVTHNAFLHAPEAEMLAHEGRHPALATSQLAADYRNPIFRRILSSFVRHNGAKHFIWIIL